MRASRLRRVKTRAENIRGGPFDGGWQEPPTPDEGSIPTAWLPEAATPYFVHVYMYDGIGQCWRYHGMCIEAELLNDQDEESGE